MFSRSSPTLLFVFFPIGQLLCSGQTLHACAPVSASSSHPQYFGHFDSVLVSAVVPTKIDLTGMVDVAVQRGARPWRGFLLWVAPITKCYKFVPPLLLFFSSSIRMRGCGVSSRCIIETGR